MPAAPTSNQETSLSQKKRDAILIVEDQPVAAEAVKQILTNLECDVDIAINGLSALRLTKQKHYDLIIMDIGLPDMDGYEVAKQIRLNEHTYSHKVPIVALTAHVAVENKELCLTAGMNAVFTKPLLQKQAIQILNVFLPHHTNNS
jgi:CheY-like chemotaxis protein